ncbi:MAG TPA: caspase family protein [Kofleriaceae bacterium]|jgi:hypothetical protein
MLRRLVLAACLVCGASRAHADTGIATYAIVVGSNTGGPGQTDLKFAEDDARKVAEVLTELGGYAPSQVDVVVHPTPAQLRERLDALETRVAADAAAGRQARVFFYYSGHARAQAIDLGSEELSLAELRERLFHLPATLTIVVLDACQSGAFSRIKGAAPAADFSFSSRQHLDAAGIAVLASSSGSELSQESTELGGSYFTHNLLVGLRGAGDANNDGQVTIDEAYRYAYNQTLLETAETAVGGQHVTFEADLKGHGEVPLSFPRVASAAIVLPPALQGKTLVSERRGRSVVAEIYKSKGTAVRIAVAPGDYDVLVRDGDTLERCGVTAPGTIDLGDCRHEAVIASTTKGGGFEHPNRIELSGSFGGDRSDGYTNTLSNFGYVQDGFLAVAGGPRLTGLRQLTPYVWAGLRAGYDFLPDWNQSVVGAESIQQKFSWHAWTFDAVGRASFPFARYFHAYVEGALGVGIGQTLLDGAESTNRTSNVGPSLAAGAGIYFDTPWGPGLMWGYEYDYAPVFKDLIGDTHAIGGSRGVFAITERF